LNRGPATNVFLGMTASQTAGPRVGFVGLGDIGGPMAARCIAEGFPVTLWARRPASLEQFEAGTYKQANTPAELGAASDVVGVAVFSEQDVREVVLGEGGIAGGLARGGIVLLHSTVSAAFAEELGERLAEQGIVLMDVPVSGLRARAITGELMVMAGGPADAFDVALPVMRAYGARVHRFGPLGSALKVKAVNQTLLFANIAVAGQALQAAERLGLDRRATAEALQFSTGSSIGLQQLTGRAAEDPAFAGHALNTALKDLAAADEIAAASGVELGPLREIAALALDVIRAAGAPGEAPS
jgi:3-hydroxyisobutyrate dehydrogenase